jgi:hypothetical protein
MKLNELKQSEQMLTLQHYKLPLIAVPKPLGVGYYGALSVTMDGSKVQCHICGKLFQDLSLHIMQRHNKSVVEYREDYKLAPTTALISETNREARKAGRLAYNAEHEIDYSALGKLAVKAREKAGTLNNRWTITLETKNKRGVCPDQLIAKIQEVADELGHTPSISEFIEVTGGQRFKHLIFKTFGSWKSALKIAKLQPRGRVQNAKRNNYSNEELLEYLVVFAQEHKRIPTATDGKRGFIPSVDVYKRRFGSLPEAREIAGVYNFVSRDSFLPRVSPSYGKAKGTKLPE